jgi:hypothetical protein
VVFELLNDQNKVIGRQTLQTGGSWELSWGERPTINVNASSRQTLNFATVNANDISDRMSIKVATVNGVAAETAARNGVLQIRASSREEFARNDRFRFARGTILGFARHDDRPNSLTIPDNIWGDPVIAIGERAFASIGVINVRISNGINVADNAFVGNRGTVQGFEIELSGNGRELTIISGQRDLSYLTIPSQLNGKTVIAIGPRAFANNPLRIVAIPSSVRTIGEMAFFNDVSFQRNHREGNIRLAEITIGANVNMQQNSFGREFDFFVNPHTVRSIDISFARSYNQNGRIAGNYQALSTRGGDTWWVYGATSSEASKKAEETRRENNSKNNLAIFGLGAALVGALALMVLIGSAVSND